jgi:hypothetical protein
MPDPISFFQSAAVLLKESGLVSLVMPDKRMMFDFFKPLTITSDWLLAHHHRLTRHTKKTAFDWTAYNVSENHEIVWSVRPLGTFNFFGNDVLREAKRKFDETTDDPARAYEDYHGTICTPSSLRLIFLELAYLDLVPFEPDIIFPRVGCEFYITLQKNLRLQFDSSALRRDRLALMKATIRELSEQARWLLDD